MRPRQGAGRPHQAHRQVDRRARAGHQCRIRIRIDGVESMSNLPLSGEIALVTGASRGIGAAIANELAAQGATVIGTATSEAGAQAIAERLAANGGHGRVLDVANGESVDSLIDSIAKDVGPVSILVNNAGIT